MKQTILHGIKGMQDDPHMQCIHFLSGTSPASRKVWRGCGWNQFEVAITLHWSRLSLCLWRLRCRLSLCPKQAIMQVYPVSPQCEPHTSASCVTANLATNSTCLGKAKTRKGPYEVGLEWKCAPRLSPVRKKTFYRNSWNTELRFWLSLARAPAI